LLAPKIKGVKTTGGDINDHGQGSKQVKKWSGAQRTTNDHNKTKKGGYNI
jgi:hypothetical protein